jgi:hypothetical protein
MLSNAEATAKKGEKVVVNEGFETKVSQKALIEAVLGVDDPEIVKSVYFYDEDGEYVSLLYADAIDEIKKFVSPEMMEEAKAALNFCQKFGRKIEYVMDSSSDTGFVLRVTPKIAQIGIGKATISTCLYLFVQEVAYRDY